MTRIYQLEVLKHKQERKSSKYHKLDVLFVFEQKVFYVKCPGSNESCKAEGWFVWSYIGLGEFSHRDKLTLSNHIGVF